MSEEKYFLIDTRKFDEYDDVDTLLTDIKEKMRVQDITDLDDLVVIRGVPMRVFLFIRET